MNHKPLMQREEVANALTHSIGVLASLIGGALLITLAAMSGDLWHVISAVVYSSALFILYTASTVYHATRHGDIKARLEIADHCAIFLLIAGTYTPFTLVSLRGVWGWSLFGIIWGLAIIGVILKLFVMGRLRRLSTLIYIAMGWLVIVAAEPMVRALSLPALILLLLGGITYTAGTFFYHNERIPYAHTIWHLFVLGGSACHFVAVAIQLLPGGTA